MKAYNICLTDLCYHVLSVGKQFDDERVVSLY